MNGKDKCELLKSIRKMTAEKNGIPYNFPECTHTGPCRGTCAKCEAELKYLNRKIEARKRAGKAVAAVVMSAGILAAAGCGPIDAIKDVFNARKEPVDDLSGAMPEPADDIEVLDGEVAYEPEDDTEQEKCAVPDEKEAVPIDETELSGDVAYIPEDVDMD